MIKYNLICKDGHEFEGWFQNSEAFDKQAKAKQLVCAICGDSHVSKALMAPSISSSAKKGQTDEKASDYAMLQKEIREAVKQIRQHVEANADYVGNKFAEEARKIHYEETETRDIYGEATASEIKELSEEGVAFQALPTLPEEKN